MGQKTLPALNRTTKHSFWPNFWTSSKNYSLNFLNEHYLRKFSWIFWQYWFTINKEFYYHFRLYQSNKEIVDSFRMPYIEPSKDFYQYLWTYLRIYKKIVFFSSRVFILRYKSWLILYVYLYIPTIFNKHLKQPPLSRIIQPLQKLFFKKQKNKKKFLLHKYAIEKYKTII